MMTELQSPGARKALGSRSALWITCKDCGQVNRVLAVMASRVLRDRKRCAECGSAQSPDLSLTSSGAHIPASEARGIVAEPFENESLHAWIMDDWKTPRLLQAAGQALRTLALRFSGRRERQRVFRRSGFGIRTRETDACQSAGGPGERIRS